MLSASRGPRASAGGSRLIAAQMMPPSIRPIAGLDLWEDTANVPPVKQKGWMSIRSRRRIPSPR